MDSTEREIADSAELATWIEEMRVAVLESGVDYARLPDDAALLLLALDRALDGKTFERAFFTRDLGLVAPLEPDLLVARLRAAGAIILSPEHSKPGAFYVKDGKRWSYNQKAAYVVVQDEFCVKPADGMMVLRNRVMSQRDLLHALWMDYAISDCLDYLDTELQKYSISLSEEDDVEVAAVVRNALATFSVSQVWCSIWKVTKDTAALAQSRRGYGGRRVAADSFPKRLMHNLEGATKKLFALGQWTRPVDQPAGAVGQLFYEYFGIDENAGPDSIRSSLPCPPAPTVPDGLTENGRREINGSFLRFSERGIGPEFLDRFALEVRGGRDVAEAYCIVAASLGV